MPCSEPMSYRHAPGSRNQRRQHLALGVRLRMVIAATVLLASHCAYARDLGVIGPVYAIAEPSLIEVIQAKLREMQANGALARLQRESQARIRREVEQPTPVAGITKTIRARTFHFDSDTVSRGLMRVPGATMTRPSASVMG